MNLYRLASDAAAGGNPVRAGLIGAGKFGSMFLSQALTTVGLEVTAVADLSAQKARETCIETGWERDRIADLRLFENGQALCACDDVDVVIEATGSPAAGVVHALAAIENGKHIIMVNVEADVLCGPALARRARAAGTVYSMAYGDQPALVAEMVDWARAAGFIVQAAGKGTKYLPAYHHVTPEDVWTHYGMTPQEALKAGMNSQMFNSFLDGTKSAIEMAAIANACAMSVAEEGLRFPPCGVDNLAHVLRPREEGGQLPGKGMVEVVSSLERDGRPVFRDLRWGVYVVIEAPNEYSAACFRQYGLNTDSTGRYAAMYKPFHLVGMELGISVLSAQLRKEPTGQSRAFNADAVAVAKRDLKPGELLDGEGGYTVWGKCMPATASVAAGALPVGLAHGIRMKRAVACDTVITRADIEALPDTPATRLRAETESMTGRG